MDLFHPYPLPCFLAREVKLFRLLPIQLEQKSRTGGIVGEGCFTIELIHSGIKGGVRFGEYRKYAE